MGVFGPRTRIPRHNFATNLLRLHCTLFLPKGARSILRVGNVTLRHQPGQCFWFDEGVAHEVDYFAPNDWARWVLLVDVLHPAWAEAKGGGAAVNHVEPFSPQYWAKELFAVTASEMTSVK